MKSENRSNTADSLVLYFDSPSEMFPQDDANASAAQVPVERLAQTSSLPEKKKIQRAIYAHIRAVRALGRERITTGEIAEALSLPVSEVNRAVTGLKKKGVRPL